MRVNLAGKVDSSPQPPTVCSIYIYIYDPGSAGDRGGGGGGGVGEPRTGIIYTREFADRHLKQIRYTYIYIYIHTDTHTHTKRRPCQSLGRRSGDPRRPSPCGF